MCLRLLISALCASLITIIGFALTPSGQSLASDKTVLHLNRQDGPLGVTLTLSGTNFPPGSANLSYIDSQNVPGTFVPPSDTSVQVTNRGSFVTNNLIMPQSGAVGPWKIVVTDSQGTISTIRYTVLAAPGQTTAGSPTLTITPASGTSGDAITFVGTNWLPAGTTVNLLLQTGANSILLLAPAATSDTNGDIGGTFHLPANLTATTANVFATDAATGALRAQAPITISNTAATPTTTPTVSPTASPSPQMSPSPTNTPISIATSTLTSTPIATNNTSGSNNTGSPLGKMDAAVWGPLLLIVGALLAVAALMLVLFMIPRSERRSNHI
ncbi:MAG: hypothetical protein NVS3B14_11400 [Ktedonobacteraceae bacterium]